MGQIGGWQENESSLCGVHWFFLFIFVHDWLDVRVHIIRRLKGYCTHSRRELAENHPKIRRPQSWKSRTQVFQRCTTRRTRSTMVLMRKMSLMARSPNSWWRHARTTSNKSNHQKHAVQENMERHPYQKTHARGKEANSQYKWPNGPQVLISYTRTAQTLQKEATTIAANHMKHQLKWHTKTTKYERLPNTALQIAATKSLRFRPGSRTDKKFSRMGQKTFLAFRACVSSSFSSSSSDFLAPVTSFFWLDFSTLLFNCPYCRKLDF